jgi:hypothetical protein
MSRPNDLPAIDKFPHGTRARYVSGCRCDLCRKANRDYAHKRAVKQIFGDWNGLVDSSRARRHILRLSTHGIGRRSVSQASGVAQSVIHEIRQGTKKTIRARTEKQILSVTKEAFRSGTLVSAAGTWNAIDHLVSDEGFSKAEIARRLEYKSPALQIKRERITGRTLRRFQQFYSDLMAEAEPDAGSSATLVNHGTVNA